MLYWMSVWDWQVGCKMSRLYGCRSWSHPPSYAPFIRWDSLRNLNTCSLEQKYMRFWCSCFVHVVETFRNAEPCAIFSLWIVKTGQIGQASSMLNIPLDGMKDPMMKKAALASWPHNLRRSDRNNLKQHTVYVVS